jgi:septal ring factor EnvC (AmiA/AmiB activator)
MLSSIVENIKVVEKEIEQLKMAEEENRSMFQSIVSAIEQMGISLQPYRPVGMKEDSAYR